MVRYDIVRKVAETSSLEEKDADKIVDAFFNAITEALRRGERVELRGLGTFGVKTRAPKIARNPKTGVEVKLPSVRVPFFRCGRELKVL